ncbi:phosphatidylserine/phosphatidylglycerophosphate/cardiolipin synthase family protein [Nitrosospira sp. NpAV]|uniref:phospholipase D-like domain-containing protein n=1 Tax=Nitrosospira sp. NpAV TaxID=58133 RepID=UPI000698214A|nr:phospholipase D-like domain-containing protein [Nitrosospira sp. NpAV]
MAKLKPKEHSREAMPATRVLAAQAFSRAAGAPLVHGNNIRLLKDGGENYSAWLDAIYLAEETIYFENYIIRDDKIGQQFADAFITKAKEGVRVRVLYDWMGSFPEASGGFWRRLSDGGVEVRCFNPPRLDSPLGWVSRLHRKSLCVDNCVAFISGLCVGQMWAGYAERGIPPWRDTGVEVSGPIVADVVQAFFRAWAETGPELPADEMPERESIPATGAVDLRVLASVTATAGLYRLEQLITVLAQKRLWLTDAYFVGTTSYVQALRGAAMDGVDVRLLVPGSNGDLKFLRPISRAGYRPLLEAGVRVFEWNGSMLHAKTAVADSRWARVGSSNLNIASWLGNWELDVAVEDPGFAYEMEQMYLKDLDNATEIVLGRKNRVRPVAMPESSATAPALRGGMGRRKGGSASQLTAGAIRVSNTVGAALTSRLVLGAAEAKIMMSGGVILLGLAIAASLEPLLIAAPFILIAGWIGIALLIQAYHLHGSTQNRRASDRMDDKIEPFLSRDEPSEEALAGASEQHRDSPSEIPAEAHPDKARDGIV